MAIDPSEIKIPFVDEQEQSNSNKKQNKNKEKQINLELSDSKEKEDKEYLKINIRPRTITLNKFFLERSIYLAIIFGLLVIIVFGMTPVPNYFFDDNPTKGPKLTANAIAQTNNEENSKTNIKTKTEETQSNANTQPTQSNTQSLEQRSETASETTTSELNSSIELNNEETKEQITEKSEEKPKLSGKITIAIKEVNYTKYDTGGAKISALKIEIDNQKETFVPEINIFIYDSETAAIFKSSKPRNPNPVILPTLKAGKKTSTIISTPAMFTDSELRKNIEIIIKDSNSKQIVAKHLEQISLE